MAGEILPAMTKPVISTVVLNWNRSHLLEQTLQSYIETVSCPHELWIVDNYSTDNSRKVIEKFVNAHPKTKVIFLPENRGGEAYNEAIPHLSGNLVYLCENDQIHMPGWCEKTLHAFQTYRNLGQLSLHCPVPTDDEAWVSKPVKIRFVNGCLLYLLQDNVTTSSIIRRSLFQHGLRIINMPSNNKDIKLPDDGRISGAVKAMGLWVGYCDRYYVRNIGHESKEIESDPDYYQTNYKAKTDVGPAELKKRIELQKQLRNVQRKTMLFPREQAIGELSSQPVGGLDPRYWSMFDGRTLEVESLEFIHSLVRMLKPASALETGGWLGYTATAISLAITANGFGKLTSIEDDINAYAHLAERIKRLSLSNVQAKNDKSERFAAGEQYDFVLFNSVYEDPEEEFFHIIPFLNEGATLVFTGYRREMHQIKSLPKILERFGLLSGQFYDTPRGLYVGKYKPVEPPESRRTIFCMSSGRSGTAYLTSLLKGIPGLIALHEPEPKYQWQTLPLQQNPAHAEAFVRNHKQPWIKQLPDATYFEASHYMHKGFFEAWLNTGLVPDIIVMQRELRAIALSWYGLNVDFFANPQFVKQHMLHPEDTRELFLPLPDWKSYNNYQLCYWYALEQQKRAEHYAKQISKKGAKVFTTSLEGLSSGKDIQPLLVWLGVKTDKRGMEIIHNRSKQRINDKNQFKNAKRLESINEMDFDKLEAEVNKHHKSK
jgi:glycosyltransferase involved in cell wall biosynthesis